MEIVSLTVTRDSLESIVVPILRDQVFHAASYLAYQRIIKSGEIKNNSMGEFQLNPGSEYSYFRAIGYVCLYDFRGSKFEKYPYLGYSLHDISVSKIAIFILDESIYKDLKEFDLDDALIIDKTQVVPILEVGYPGSVSLDRIKTVLIITIEDWKSKDEINEEYMARLSRGLKTAN